MVIIQGDDMGAAVFYGELRQIDLMDCCPSQFGVTCLRPGGEGEQGNGKCAGRFVGLPGSYHLHCF